jgi:hypothetical protein
MLSRPVLGTLTGVELDLELDRYVRDLGSVLGRASSVSPCEGMNALLRFVAAPRRLWNCTGESYPPVFLCVLRDVRLGCDERTTSTPLLRALQLQGVRVALLLLFWHTITVRRRPP